MWGAARHEQSTGIHRPLLATAMVFASPTRAAASAGDAIPQMTLITIDHCLLGAMEAEHLRVGISAATQRPIETIQITASHTHAAGLLTLDRCDLPGGQHIRPYFDELTKRLVAAVNDASSQQRGCHIVYGSGRCDLAVHRDFWDASIQAYVCGFNPGWYR